MLARTLVDLLVVYWVMPVSAVLFHQWWPDSDAWHPQTVLIFFAVLRACAPYAASFQGSRAGRVLTRELFTSFHHQWQPVMRIQQLNLESDDCCERDEVSENADLARVAKLVAKALGASQSIGVDGSQNQAVALALEGFSQIGAGSGGYAVYVCHRRVWSADTKAEGEETPILLHVTPYGPSILGVMPRYVVLEFEDSIDRRGKWSEYLSQKVYEGPPVVEGYCYQGAFFSPHHFAALGAMYDKQLYTFAKACRAMCTPKAGRSPNPPTDLRSLKVFLAEGKLGRKRRRNDRQMRHLQGKIDSLTRQLETMWKKQTAPSGIILYFEGLDCSGKSSTGGLVQEALEKAGYHVSIRQYNRPPTPDQKQQPWMDRFQVPDETSSVVLAIPQGGSSEEGTAKDDNAAATNELWSACENALGQGLVWDRGPLGDFVFGELGQATRAVRQERYAEFMEFDRTLYEKNILFCKMLFVTNRDSIAQTLGKRLAQRQMAQDLHTWLQASRGGGDSPFGEEGFEGWDEITLHIDPTDFIAFNNYQRNLRIFANAALHTDADENPWLVVNTTDRYAARKQLLQAFAAQVQRFHARHPRAVHFLPPLSSFSFSSHHPRRPLQPQSPPPPQVQQQQQSPDMSGLTMAETTKGFVRPFPLPGLVALAGLLFLVFYYAEHTAFGQHVDTFVDWLSTRGPGATDNNDNDEAQDVRKRLLAALILDI
jgi:polyphosphate kinase 2 (PPK2 family)